MKIAILFDNFGHYHLARLQALSGQADLLAIEVAPKSRDHAWERQSGGFKQVTLIDQGDSRAVDWKQLYGRLRRALEEFRPEVLAVPGWSSRGAFAAVAACRGLQIPLVVMSDSNQADQVRSPWKERIKTRYVGMFSAAFVAGAWSKDYICGLGMAPERVSLGYDVVDNEFFAAGADAARNDERAVRGRLGLPARYFLACARFIERKNLSLLLRAYGEYRRTTTSTPLSLVVLGDGPLQMELKALSARLGLEQWIQFPGYKQYGELPDYYGLAEAFVCPSWWETWGLVVNEAMASGLPVIASDRCGCLPELLVPGKTGLVFDPFNETQLAQCLLQIASRSGLGPAMGRLARTHISEWGLQRFVQGLLAAGECALESGPKCSSIFDPLILRVLASRL